MTITNKLNSKQIEDIIELHKICDIERIPNFDPNIYIDPKLPSFYLEYKDDLLIGFLSLFYVDKKEMEIVCAIHPSFRHQGYFTKLFSESKKVIPENLVLLFQIPSNYVNKEILAKYNLKYHHGEEELIKNNSTNLNSNLSIICKDDILDVAKILADSFDDEISEEVEFINQLIEQKGTTPYVFKKGNTIIGFIVTSNSQYIKTSHVFAFCVDQKQRSKGYGSIILNSLPENKNGYVLRVDYDNTKAKKLYVRSGFSHLSSTEYYTIA